MSASPLNGFDPLAEAIESGGVVGSLFQEATKRVILNILRSYTGYYDVFSEVIQNFTGCAGRETSLL